jgi:hypothetical protein
MPKAGGKWNTMEITAKGRDLTVSANGQKTAQVRSGLHTEGAIALQFRRRYGEVSQSRAQAVVNSRGVDRILKEKPADLPVEAPNK